MKPLLPLIQHRHRHTHTHCYMPRVCLSGWLAISRAGHYGALVRQLVFPMSAYHGMRDRHFTLMNEQVFDYKQANKHGQLHVAHIVRLDNTVECG